MHIDSGLQLDVMRELSWDYHIPETAVGIEVQLGIVTLTGTVDNATQRLAAQEAAHRVYGVRDVVNAIIIKVPTSQQGRDTEIPRAVRVALPCDRIAPGQWIIANVLNGHVALVGSVDNIRERQNAERAVGNLPGVKRVTNAVVVVEPIIAESEVRAEITAALERCADRTAEHIELQIDHGTVTLRGPVRSSAERAAAIGAARFSPGVRAVDDKLYVATTS